MLSKSKTTCIIFKPSKRSVLQTSVERLKMADLKMTKQL